MLQFLQAHSTEYISGQDLSDVLCISRVAVWKHVKKIRQLGYDVQSKQRIGYRLVSGSDAVLPWDVTSGLHTRSIGRRAYFYDSIDSTQSQALRMAGDPVNNGVVIVAARQTGGRGRAQRRWISPRGGIWMSVILDAGMGISDAALLPMASSVALARSIEQQCGVSVELKWPNDLTINAKKVAGILVDASLESNKVTSLVFGVGINYDVDTARIQKELLCDGAGRGKDGDGHSSQNNHDNYDSDINKTENFYGAATLNGSTTGVKPVQLVRRFLEELERVHDRLMSHDTEDIITEWTRRSSTIGKSLQIDTGNGMITGRALRIDSDGALVIATGKDKAQKRIIAGEIIGTGPHTKE